MEDLIPFEKIQLAKLLGKGQFASVFRGTLDDADVAVKRIPQEPIQESSDVSWDPAVYFKREVDILRSLHHPNVLKFKGICYHKDNLYIVTEFVDGGDLRHALATTIPDWPQRLKIAIEIAAALSYLHSRNIVHRDVKTENVLMSRDLVVKLCDFGFAREVSSLKRPNHYTICGSEFFEAPEIMFCIDYDERIDIFSYGLVLCEIISRQQPSMVVFGRVIPGFGIDPNEISQRAEPGCPSVLIDMASACCDDNPDKRPPLEQVIASFSACYEELTGKAFIPYTEPMPSTSAQPVHEALPNDPSAPSSLSNNSVLSATTAIAEGHSHPLSHVLTSSEDSSYSRDHSRQFSSNSLEDDESVNNNGDVVRPLLPLRREKTSKKIARKIVREEILPVPPSPRVTTSHESSDTQPPTPEPLTASVSLPTIVTIENQARQNEAHEKDAAAAAAATAASSSKEHRARTGPRHVRNPSKEGGTPRIHLSQAASTEDSVSPQEQRQRLCDIFYYLDHDLVSGYFDRAGLDLEKAIALILADETAKHISSNENLADLTTSSDSFQEIEISSKARSISVPPPPIVIDSPPSNTVNSSTSSSPTTPSHLLGEGDSKWTLVPGSTSLSSGSSFTLPRKGTSSGSPRNKKTVSRLSSTGRLLESWQSRNKRKDDGTPEIIKIGRTLLVTYALRSSYMVDTDPASQSRWTEFLVNLTTNLEVGDCQVRSKNSRLKTFRKCFNAEDLIYWLMFVEQDITQRPQAMEMGTILVKLEIIVPIHGTSAGTFKEGAAVLFRYRHDQAALQANLQTKALADGLKVEKKPAPIRKVSFKKTSNSTGPPLPAEASKENGLLGRRSFSVSTFLTSSGDEPPLEPPSPKVKEPVKRQRSKPEKGDENSSSASMDTPLSPVVTSPSPPLLLPTPKPATLTPPKDGTFNRIRSSLSSSNIRELAASALGLKSK